MADPLRDGAQLWPGGWERNTKGFLVRMSQNWLINQALTSVRSVAVVRVTHSNPKQTHTQKWSLTWLHLQIHADPHFQRSFSSFLTTVLYIFICFSRKDGWTVYRAHTAFTVQFIPQAKLYIKSCVVWACSLLLWFIFKFKLVTWLSKTLKSRSKNQNLKFQCFPHNYEEHCGVKAQTQYFLTLSWRGQLMV